MKVLDKGYARLVTMNLGFGLLVATFLVTLASRVQPDFTLCYLYFFEMKNLLISPLICNFNGVCCNMVVFVQVGDAWFARGR